MVVATRRPSGTEVATDRPRMKLLRYMNESGKNLGQQMGLS
jgi:hypothetical protein